MLTASRAADAAPCILCIGPNPGLDRVLVVPDFGIGKITRAREVLPMASGKGINVARAVRTLGGQALCAGFLGGKTGTWIAEAAAAEGLPGRWTWIEGETRTNIIIVHPERGDATVINEQGPPIAPADWARLGDDVLSAARHAVPSAAPCACTCISGSLPPGVGTAQFGDLISRLAALPIPLWVDTSGEALRQAITQGGNFGIKVTGEELGAALGRPVTSVDQARDAALDLLGEGCRHLREAVLTLGKRGAVYCGPTGCWWAQQPEIQPVSTIGSGDSFLAALTLYLAGQRQARAASMPADEVATPPAMPPEAEALRRAVAAGAANALSIGSGRFAYETFAEMLRGSRVQPL